MVDDWSAVDRDADYWTRQEQIVKRPAGVMTKRVQNLPDRVYLHMTSYADAYPWDGRPKYETALGYGH